MKALKPTEILLLIAALFLIFGLWYACARREGAVGRLRGNGVCLDCPRGYASPVDSLDCGHNPAIIPAMAISIRFLKNHGAVVTRTQYGKKRRRFVRPNGLFKVSEVVAALKTNDMQLYRLEARGLLKTRRVDGERMIPLREVKRLKADRAALYPRLKKGAA